MKRGEAGEGLVTNHLPGLAGLFVLLFFFSILDPVSLILAHISALLLFFAESRAARGIGFLGLAAFVYLIARAGGISPDSMAILTSSILFGLLLRFRRFGTVFYPSLQSGLVTLILVMALFLLFDREGLAAWTGEIREVMQEALEASFTRIQETGAFGLEELVELKGTLSGVVELMITLLPAIVCLNLLLAGVIGLKLLHLLRIGVSPLLPETRELRFFSFSDAFIWGLIAGLLSLILPLPDSVRTILFNLLALAFTLYLFRGLAVGIFWLRKRGLSMVGIGAIYAFLFALLPPLFIICLLIPGVLDTWFDFRTPRESMTDR